MTSLTLQLSNIGLNRVDGGPVQKTREKNLFPSLFCEGYRVFLIFGMFLVAVLPTKNVPTVGQSGIVVGSSRVFFCSKKFGERLTLTVQLAS